MPCAGSAVPLSSTSIQIAQVPELPSNVTYLAFKLSDTSATVTIVCVSNLSRLRRRSSSVSPGATSWSNVTLSVLTKTDPSVPWCANAKYLGVSTVSTSISPDDVVSVVTRTDEDSSLPVYASDCLNERSAVELFSVKEVRIVGLAIMF